MKKNNFIFILCIVSSQLSLFCEELFQLFLNSHHFISPNTPLTRAYPELMGKLPHIFLGDFPTPVHSLHNCGETIGLKNLYIKRDDLSGKKGNDGFRLFGGNKVRKLEFLLADALNNNAKTVLTFGCAGSNHVVATATYAQFLGLSCIAMLKPQPNSPIVQRNLLLMNHVLAELHYSCEEDRPRATESVILDHQNKFGIAPYQIPTGGSCPLGALGFVNAAFELAEQIEHGDLNEPDYIYVAAGSCGTIVGLLLGVRAAGLHTKIIGVCVEPEIPIEFQEKIIKLFNETNEMLHNMATTFPIFEIEVKDISLIHDMCGTGYGESFAPAQEAIALVADTEHIQLDGTYTGKAFGALVRDVQESRIASDAKVLFWNTYCGDVIGSLYSDYDYHQLPINLWPYFQKDSL